MLIVITGPPAAGKSSWIKAHAKPDDIVIDLDLMALAMAGPGADHHAHGDILMRVVHRARFAALNEAYQHLDKVDVYVIHTQPSAKALAKYKRLEARIVTVDPGREIVMARVKAMRQPEMERVVSRWYNSRRGQSRGVVFRPSRDW
ncbi:AAA family ATPase [Streptomyces sp. NPDC059904]|uniref:AAA family ATPase n=1 Tax=Streptomyces sp. NPDC059904 TaxID=3346996 RepID=UPI00365E5A19